MDKKNSAQLRGPRHPAVKRVQVKKTRPVFFKFILFNRIKLFLLLFFQEFGMRAKSEVMFWTLSALELDLHAPILTSSLIQNFPWPCLNLNTTCGLFCCPAREDRSRVKSCTDTGWTHHFGSWTRASGRLRVQSF